MKYPNEQSKKSRDGKNAVGKFKYYDKLSNI